METTQIEKRCQVVGGMVMNNKKNSAVRGSGSFEEAESYGDILPQQYYDMVAGRRRGNGARDLILAVLEDAIRTYVTNRGGNTARQRRLFDEVKSWIDTRGDRSPFAFETICETFDIEPDDLRRRMSNLPPENFKRRVRTPKRSRVMKAA